MDLNQALSSMSLTGATPVAAGAAAVPTDGQDGQEDQQDPQDVMSQSTEPSDADDRVVQQELENVIQDLGATLVLGMVRVVMHDRKHNSVLNLWLTREAKADGGQRGNLGPDEWALYRQWYKARQEDNPEAEMKALRRRMRQVLRFWS